VSRDVFERCNLCWGWRRCRVEIRLTPFGLKVYEVVATIPEGKVSTYGLVASKIGCRSPRAVGQALRVNPFAPEVPCHRVVSSDLTLGGFGGETDGENIRRKKQLLVAEGVKFVDERTIHLDCLYDFM
jgi:methylated-DNA-[protein]-cysteine S-methyltransferase